MVFLRIVIPTKNEESYLPKLLESIKKQSFKDLEIVIADGNSTDKTREIAKFWGCKVVGGNYLNVGRNNGAKGCKAKLLCFIDADILLPDANFLFRALKEFEDRELDVAGTLQKPLYSNSEMLNVLYRLVYEFTNLSMSSFQNTKTPFMQVLMFVKTNVFFEVGGFPDYEFGEDSAFAKLAVAQGYKFGILHNAGKAWISPRRFEEKGFLPMILKYLYFNGMRLTGHEFIRGKSKIKYGL